jgi:hypothetical protein
MLYERPRLGDWGSRVQIPALRPTRPHKFSTSCMRRSCAVRAKTERIGTKVPRKRTQTPRIFTRLFARRSPPRHPLSERLSQSESARSLFAVEKPDIYPLWTACYMHKRPYQHPSMVPERKETGTCGSAPIAGLRKRTQRSRSGAGSTRPLTIFSYDSVDCRGLDSLVLEQLWPIRGNFCRSLRRHSFRFRGMVGGTREAVMADERRRAANFCRRARDPSTGGRASAISRYIWFANNYTIATDIAGQPVCRRYPI